MTECQGCGAWNDASRTLCVLCGAPLAETDEWDAAAEPPPLPPLPDGGLRASMPFWLREPPAAPAAPAALAVTASAAPAGDAPPLGPSADPRTFLTDEDFPQWLRDLASQRLAIERSPARLAEEPPAPAPEEAPPAADSPPYRAESAAVTVTAAPARAPVLVPPADTPAPVGVAADVPVSVPVPAPAPPKVADHLPEERPRRERWETLLLAALLIGVAAAALWALVANGVLGPGL